MGIKTALYALGFLLAPGPAHASYSDGFFGMIVLAYALPVFLAGGLTGMDFSSGPSYSSCLAAV